MTTIIGEMARRVSESLILPFNCTTLAKSIESESNAYLKTYQSIFDSYQIDVNPLKWAISNFTRNAQDFHLRLDSLDKSK